MSIEPALTAEEWTFVKPIKDYEDACHRADQIEDAVNGLDAPNFHRAAAFALYGQLFGFTREDVAALRANCEGFRWVAQRTGVMGAMEIEISKLLNIADRIEALLPPENE